MAGEKVRNKVKGQVGPALYSVLPPGDDAVAGVLAEAGAGFLPDLLAGLATLGLAIAGSYDFSARN